MKFKILLVLLFCSSYNAVDAQNDSNSKYVNHLFNLQYLFSPSLNYDQGKHVIHLQIGSQYSPFEQMRNSLNFGYSTHFKNHCVGLFFKSKVDNQTQLLQSTYGIQYAYAFTLKNSFLGKDVKMIPGMSWSHQTISQDFNKLIFGDQIDDRLGFVNLTAERDGIGNIKVQTFDLSLLIRNQKYFVSYLWEDLFKPVGTFYFANSSNEQFRLASYHQLNIGHELITQPHWNLWALADMKYTDSHQDYLRFGLSTQLFHHYMASVKINGEYREISAGYYRSHFRVYAKYQNTPNPYFTYFSFGSWSAGIIKTIGKQ